VISSLSVFPIIYSDTEIAIPGLKRETWGTRIPACRESGHTICLWAVSGDAAAAN